MDLLGEFFAQFSWGELIAVALLTLIASAVIDVKLEGSPFHEKEDQVS